MVDLVLKDPRKKPLALDLDLTAVERGRLHPNALCTLHWLIELGHAETTLEFFDNPFRPDDTGIEKYQLLSRDLVRAGNEDLL